MNDVKGLQPFFVLIAERVIDIFDPPIMRDIIAGGTGVKVNDSIVPTIHHWPQFSNQVEDDLVEVEVGVQKPFTYDYHYGSVVFVHAGHIDAVSSLHLAEVGLFSLALEFFKP